MAQTNFTPILLYASSTPTNAPSAGNLTNSATGSEIAINIADKNLFFKDSGGTVNTVPIRQSSTSSNGWLSATDWNTFNNKSNTNGTVTSVAALTLGTTGTDLSSTVANGTTTPVITLNVPTASAANRGALSAADWSTFNGKQAALVSGTNIKTVGGVTLLGSGDVGTIGVGYGGTGQTSFTAGQIHYGSFSTSANLYFSGTNLGLGTSSPNSNANRSTLTMQGAWGGQLDINVGATNHCQFGTDNFSSGYSCRIQSQDSILFKTNTTTISTVMFASGGVSIGNTTDPGATNLSVTGTITTASAKTASGSLSVANATATTIFTTAGAGIFQVYAYLAFSGAASVYTASAIVMNDGNGARIVANNTANLSLTLSGLAVQVTQTSTVTQTVSYTYLKIA